MRGRPPDLLASVVTLSEWQCGSHVLTRMSRGRVQYARVNAITLHAEAHACIAGRVVT